ncbi:Uncharacterized protein dnl_35690 [Desulfonema limicola]|uniref:Uncharacterized protein n=1 Tax=Desulfonema limicola TaxID=45656 RepID=A0A975GHZ2_9BACT|nr:hypothetical protein [Desulfonema limicola]QTA81238.1 Uncharacterized protein dnl_35690 [Desulfonema limicola]
MARTKFHVTPDSGRISISLNKRQLKEFKKMSIEFEVSMDEILQIAVDTFIKKYQTTSIDEIDKNGIESICPGSKER